MAKVRRSKVSKVLWFVMMLFLMSGIFSLISQQKIHEVHAEDLIILDDEYDGSVTIEKNKFQYVYPGSKLWIDYELDSSDNIIIESGDNIIENVSAPEIQSKQFDISEEFLQKIVGDVVISSEFGCIHFINVKIQLAQVPTIDDILPSNFPISHSNGWICGNKCVYVYNGKLTFQDLSSPTMAFNDFSITDKVERDGNNFKVTNNDTSDSVTFEMRSNVLVSITLNTNNIGLISSFLKGKYNPIVSIEDSTGNAAIKDQDYQLDSDKLIIMTNDLTISGVLVDKYIKVNAGVNHLTFNNLSIVDFHTKSVSFEENNENVDLTLKGSNKIVLYEQVEFGIYFDGSGAINGDGNLSIVGTGTETIGINTSKSITLDCSGDIEIDLPYCDIYAYDFVFIGENSSKILCYISSTGYSTIYCSGIINDYGKIETGSREVKSSEENITDSVVFENYKPMVNEDVALSLLIKSPTVSDILPDDFPTERNGNSWINTSDTAKIISVGNAGGLNGLFLSFQNAKNPSYYSAVYCNSVVKKDDNNYKYVSDDTNVTFVMEEGILTKIIFESTNKAELNGTYVSVGLGTVENPWKIGPSNNILGVIAYLGDGTLYISGEGQMDQYREQRWPWVSKNASITSIEIAEGVTLLGDYSFIGSENLTSVSISNTVEYIGTCAFDNCINLTDIIIPESVTHIDEEAFYGCEQLNKVVCKSKIPSELGDDAFYDCGEELVIKVPLGTLQNYKTAWDDYADNIETFYTIFDILPETFPVASALGWLNEYSLSAYLDGEMLHVGNVNLDANTLLEKNDSNYIYSNAMYDVEFVTTENKLTSIVVKRVLSSTANGTFKPVVKISKPSADTKNFVYTGSALTYTIEENDAYTVSGNVQTNVGTYIVKVVLNDKIHYHWADDTTTDLEYEFVINQKAIDVTVKDADTNEAIENPNVMIIDAEKGIDPEAIFVVKVMDVKKSEDTEETENALKDADKVSKNEKIYGIYDAKLLVNDEEIQPNGTITIKMVIPEEVNGKVFKLYHIHKDIDTGTISVFEISNANISESDGTLTFQTDKLSQFAFVAEKGVDCWIHWLLIAVLVIYVILFVCFVFIYKKELYALITVLAGLVATIVISIFGNCSVCIIFTIIDLVVLVAGLIYLLLTSYKKQTIKVLETVKTKVNDIIKSFKKEKKEETEVKAVQEK